MPPLGKFEKTCIALAVSSAVLPAHAATITVTNNLDVSTGDTSSLFALSLDNGGDGVSLREAIEVANNSF